MTTTVQKGSEPFYAEGSRQGVLVLHGFTGNPQSMRPLAQRLADEGFTVDLPRLPGHGTSLDDMMSTGWSDWTATADDAYAQLHKTCDQVALVALSMGGGLAARIAESNDDVAALVLINPLVTLPPAELLEGLQQLLDSGLTTVDSIGSDIKKEGSKEASYDATPLACAQSLFEGLAPVAEHLDRITAPTLVLSSREDHVVTSSNGDAVVASVKGPVERLWLENSYHVATLDNDAAQLEDATVAFLRRHFAS